ncbi:PEPxxWA-CTERM sorting domain-containing protein [Bradyrhizobium sp. AZCC 2230]|uniref:PEPxxWA-CTERM sorting domain-containing protein n=1 Tax=Bradyrhizobium sp. AZCC 2230 TaxID=3117021 RepID=UPI002FF13CA5
MLLGKSHFSLALLLGAALSIPPRSAASATTLTFGYDATITAIELDGDLTFLANAGAGTQVGQTVHGQFSYNTGAASVSYFPNALDYSTGGLTIYFPSSTVSGGNIVRISNGSSGQDRVDVFGSTTYATAAQTHALETDFQLNLVDNTATALSSLALPASYDLAGFDFRNMSYREIDAYSPTGEWDQAQYISGQIIYSFEINAVYQMSAVPEPSTWAMLILGFASVGLMTYRRRNVLSAA